MYGSKGVVEKYTRYLTAPRRRSWHSSLLGCSQWDEAEDTPPPSDRLAYGLDCKKAHWLIVLCEGIRSIEYNSLCLLPKCSFCLSPPATFDFFVLTNFAHFCNACGSWSTIQQHGRRSLPARLPRRPPPQTSVLPPPLPQRRSLEKPRHSWRWRPCPVRR
jgi:hypothetical protein